MRVLCWLLGHKEIIEKETKYKNHKKVILKCKWCGRRIEAKYRKFSSLTTRELAFLALRYPYNEKIKYFRNCKEDKILTKEK